MNDMGGKTDSTAKVVEKHLGTFNTLTGKVLGDLGELATQFTTHGRSLAEAVELLEKSNRRTEDSVAARRASIEALVSTLDARTDDFGQRLQRFSGVLDESLDAAASRAREIAGIIAETSNESVQVIEQQYELVRTTSEEERKRTSETFNEVYDEAATQVHTMLSQSAERFAEVMQGMKQMAAEMQQELETTRAELRRGIFELPQETAESAAQMRRVIVDQIEALAELNRIVARHGRSLDAAEPARLEPARAEPVRPEPVRREPEPAYASGGGGRAPARAPRGDITTTPPTTMRADITGAPPRRPDPPAPNGQQNGANGRNGGWLSDLLTRASREESPPIAPPAPREGARGEERAPRDNIDSLESLAVDVARMIDHEAAAELWERYKRGERGVFTRRLYTPQGQKAFDEIRRKYRADPEFRTTVEQYIHEFERLLEEVSRGDRGAAVVRNYLTSDTGKVYTMLAHAAGRFDQ
jgi:DNA anti-recombination protein RmuC